MNIIDNNVSMWKSLTLFLIYKLYYRKTARSSKILQKNGNKFENVEAVKEIR